MRKIVFVITKSQIGGAQTWVNEIKKVLNEHFEIFLITSEVGWLTEQFPEKNIKIIPGLSGLTNILTSLKIARYLKSIDADIVVSSSANAGLYSRLSQLFHYHKSVYVSHGWSCIYNGGMGRFFLCKIEKILSYFTDVILCVSEQDKNKACNIIGINEKKLISIRNAITPLDLKINVNARKKILFVGRMTPPKRPDLLAKVANTFPDVDFYFVGDGPDLVKIKYDNNAVSNIFFLGEVAGFKRFHEYDVFALISDSEGLPMSALEAGSAGLPLLMSNVGGCNELIFNDENNKPNGMLFENKSEDIERSIRDILDNYQAYYSSAQSVVNEFDINNISNLYLKLFDDLINNKGHHNLKNN